MIGNQPPLAEVLADLGQWLQQWATFIQTQIEAKQIHLSKEDGLPPAMLDEGDVVTAGQTAVPRQASSPPAHWLALFAERGDRSLEEAAAASAAAAVVPVDFETGQIDTAVLTAWMTQLNDGLLAFRKQVDPQFSPEQAENVPEASQIDGVPFLPLIENDENGEGSDEAPLDAAAAEQKTPPKQVIPQPHLEERVEFEKKQPLPPSPPTLFSPTRPGPLSGNARPEIPLADARTMQRKADPAGEPLARKAHFPPATAPSSSPAPPDGGMEDGRDPVPYSSSPPHLQQTRLAPAMTETRTEWPELLPPAPMNIQAQATAVPSQPPHTVKRVTRLHLNPLLQRESSAAQMTPTVTTPPPDPDLIGSAALKLGAPSGRVTQQPAIEGLTAVPVEQAPPMAVENRLDTAVPRLSINKSAPQPPQPPEKLGQKGKTARVINSSPINRTQSPIVQAAAAPPTEYPASDRSQIKTSLPPLVEQIRDVSEERQPLPPDPLAENPSEPVIWPDEKRPSLKPEPAAVAEEKRPFSPVNRPDYQIPSPPSPRQPPQWSVTPENRWPALLPLPLPDPSPVPSWRHQPARRQRLDREQQGISWNESSS